MTRGELADADALPAAPAEAAAVGALDIAVALAGAHACGGAEVPKGHGAVAVTAAFAGQPRRAAGELARVRAGFGVLRSDDAATVTGRAEPVLDGVAAGEESSGPFGRDAAGRGVHPDAERAVHVALHLLLVGAEQRRDERRKVGLVHQGGRQLELPTQGSQLGLELSLDRVGGSRQLGEGDEGGVRGGDAERQVTRVDRVRLVAGEATLRRVSRRLVLAAPGVAGGQGSAEAPQGEEHAERRHPVRL